MWLLMFIFALPAMAQDDYNPNNPADPYMKYRITASVTPEGSGTVSGIGKYAVGTQVTMNTSAKSTDYVFKHWEKNGVKYSEQKSFKYTMTAENVDFVAVYSYEPHEDVVVYDPTNPADPNVVEKPEVTHTYFTLNLVASPEGACSFNISSGLSVEQDTYVKLEAYGNQNYDFVGWYKNGTKVSSTEAFNYLMTSDATLTAKYKVYNPQNPDDPSLNIENTTVRRGDVNRDGEININDAMMVVDYSLGRLPKINKIVSDMNGDGKISVIDAVLIIDKCLNPVIVSSISLSKSTLELEVGDSEKLTASVLPSDAVNRRVSWSSSDTSIATVDQDGNVTGVKEGNCTITCSANDGSGVVATCSVSVIEVKEYTKIEYVYNPSNAYINTGFYPTQDTRIVAEMEFPNSTFTNGYYNWHGAFGSMLGTSHVGQCRGLYFGSSKLSSGYFALSNATGDKSITTMVVNQRYIIDWNKNVININNELFHTFDYSTNYTGRTPLFIFGVPIESSTTPRGYAQYRLYSFKIYENDVLKRDLIPVIRNSDQKVCLYDKVNKTYYLPSNTSLQAGPNK